MGFFVLFIIMGSIYPHVYAAEQNVEHQPHAMEEHSHGDNMDQQMHMNGSMQMKSDEMNHSAVENSGTEEHNHGDKPEGHTHDERTTGKSGIGPDWPFIYVFLTVNIIAIAVAAAMKYKKKRVYHHADKN
ncbi:hypothetical protein [Pectinatus haikarae]|uniref:Uncharacterized protein n=2 Tax=Pectinatus haikarae TaxID=349096 RepID=A0ABT9YAU2_9FIRM|nr:hypothetical protein [Pectinatus haikarae]MDQ0204851.1 hypothetical protein [Pectinatus haikarae]